MANVDKLLGRAREYQKGFDKPLSLEAACQERVAIVTCMDGRIDLSKIFGLDIGGAEMIRNAGGRITMDVIRSLVVAIEVEELACRDVFIIHHTDCGGMAVARQHDKLIDTMGNRLGRIGGSALRLLAKTGLDNLFLQPITDLDKSVSDDINTLATHPLIPKHIGLYGFVYSTEDGSLREVTRRTPDTAARQKATEEAQQRQQQQQQKQQQAQATESTAVPAASGH